MCICWYGYTCILNKVFKINLYILVDMCFSNCGPIWETNILLFMAQFWIYATCWNWILLRYEIKYCFLSQGAIFILVNAQVVRSPETSGNLYRAKRLVSKEGHKSITNRVEFLKKIFSVLIACTRSKFRFAMQKKLT